MDASDCLQRSPNRAPPLGMRPVPRREITCRQGSGSPRRAHTPEGGVRSRGAAHMRHASFAETARQEGFDDLAEWFETMTRAKKTDAGRFEKALSDLQENAPV